MSNPIPSQLGLITIADDSLIVASDHRNNYADIQTAVNALIVALSSGNPGALLYATDGTDVAYLPDVPANGDTLVWNAAASRWEPGAVGGGSGATTYRKTTQKTVANTVSETDLFNGEFTIAANPGISAVTRITAEGDALWNNGIVGLPQFKLRLGSTVLLDTGATGTALRWSGSATRYGWRMRATIRNLGAANAQWVDMEVDLYGGHLNDLGPVAFATGEGVGRATATYGAAFNGGGAGAIDTTSAQVLAFTVTHSNANANTQIALNGALVEIV